MEVFVQLLIRAIGLESREATKAHSTFMIEMMKRLKEDLMEAEDDPSLKGNLYER